LSKANKIDLVVNVAGPRGRVLVLSNSVALLNDQVGIIDLKLIPVDPPVVLQALALEFRVVAEAADVSSVG